MLNIPPNATRRLEMPAGEAIEIFLAYLFL